MFALGPRNKPAAAIAAAPQAAPFDMAAETRDFASRLYDEVAEQYLEFRRVYFREEHPVLDTLPPRHAEIHRAELALLAENTLKLIPGAIKSIPVVGGLLEHLEHVADLHSVSESDRTSILNLTLSFLHGTQDGIQPWYAKWLLVSARNLSEVSETHYFMDFPWDACIYLYPDELSTFENALKRNDVAAIEQVVRGVAERLIRALKDPVEAEVAFAFTGPDAERRRVAYQLKTTAALALGAYLIAEEARLLLHPRLPEEAAQSALAPFPRELAARDITASSPITF